MGLIKQITLVYNPALDSLESDGKTSGSFDDRWAFTSRSTPLNYGSIAALAAASRALEGYNDKLAAECLEVAERVWEEEHSKTPHLFHHGNTTGGSLEDEELKAAVELLITTQKDNYRQRLLELWPTIEGRFARSAALAVRALPLMDEQYRERLEKLVVTYKNELVELKKQNPYGVPISTVAGQVMGKSLLLLKRITVCTKRFPKS